MITPASPDCYLRQTAYIRVAIHPGYVGYCKSCNHPIFPPFSGLPLRLEDLPETLTREIDIGVVCRECGHYDTYRNKDFRRAMVPGLLAAKTPALFWRGVYACAHTDCGLQIVVHTTADASETNL
jgi:hypothetical protein